MSIVLANGSAADPFFALAGIATVGMFLAPVASIIAYLKGHRLSSLVGIASFIAALPVTGLALPVIGQYEIQSYAVAAVGLLVVLTGAFRLAKPWSWWAQRWYGRKKLERAILQYGQ